MSDNFENPESGNLALSEQLVADIEQASLRAWPALEECELDNWRLRFTKGFTKRANSVSITAANCYGYSETELLDRIQVCEQYYHRRKQPVIFRLVQANNSDAPHTIDRVLANRNYRYADASLVLVKKLKPEKQQTQDINYVDLSSWLAAYRDISDSPYQAEQLHRLILEGIQADLLMALSYHNQKAVACGLGVVEGQLLGLFDIATHPQFRQQGFARILVTQLCASGSNAGAQHAYLQVQADNAAGISLYKALGFSGTYSYGYRIEENFPA